MKYSGEIIKVKNDGNKEKLIEYRDQIEKLWLEFPYSLNNESPLRMLLELYQRVDDSMVFVCVAVFSKRFGSFKVRKEKLEGIFKKWSLNKELEKVLKFRGELVHEEPKKRLNKIKEIDLFNTFMESINAIPIEIKYSLDHKNELICLFLYYNFLVDLSNKYIDFLVKKNLLHLTNNNLNNLENSLKEIASLIKENSYSGLLKIIEACIKIHKKYENLRISVKFKS